MYQAVKTVLAAKEQGSEVYTIDSQARVIDAVHEMNRHRVGSLLVLEGGELAGIITERDVLLRVIGAGEKSDVALVADVMTRGLVTIDPADSVGEVLELMTARRIRHLPVIEDGKLQGVVSIGDFTRWIIRDQQGQIDDLVGYIKTA